MFRGLEGGNSKELEDKERQKELVWPDWFTTNWKDRVTRVAGSSLSLSLCVCCYDCIASKDTRVCCLVRILGCTVSTFFFFFPSLSAACHRLWMREGQSWYFISFVPVRFASFLFFFVSFFASTSWTDSNLLGSCPSSNGPLNAHLSVVFCP